MSARTKSAKPTGALFVLRHKATGLFFQDTTKGGFRWVESIEDALIRARRRWMVTPEEELVPVRLVPVIVEDEALAVVEPEAPEDVEAWDWKKCTCSVSHPPCGYCVDFKGEFP